MTEIWIVMRMSQFTVMVGFHSGILKDLRDQIFEDKLNERQSLGKIWGAKIDGAQIFSREGRTKQVKALKNVFQIAGMC